ncbi:MAG: hypothetical protein AABX38_03480 [Candidatus Micrarchaeota archaeon]
MFKEPESAKPKFSQEELAVQKTLTDLRTLRVKVPEPAKAVLSNLDYAIKSYEAAAESWKKGDKKEALIFQQNGAQSYTFAISKIPEYERDMAGMAAVKGTIQSASSLRDEIRKSTQAALNDESTPADVRKSVMQQGIANVALLNQIIEDAQKQMKIVEKDGVEGAKDLQKISPSWSVSLSAVNRSFQLSELAMQARSCERLSGSEAKAVEKELRDAAAAFTKIAENAFNLKSPEKLESDIKTAFDKMASAFSNRDSFLKNRVEGITNQMRYWMVAQVRGTQPEFTPTDVEAAERNYMQISTVFLNIEGQSKREGAYNLAIRNFRTVRDMKGKIGAERERAEESAIATKRMLEDYIPAEIQSTKNFNTMTNLTKLATSFAFAPVGIALAFHGIYEQYERTGSVRGVDVGLAAAGVVVPGLGKLGKSGKTLAAAVGLTAFGVGTAVGVNDLYKSIQAFKQQNPGQELDANKLIELSAQAASVLYPLGHPARAAIGGIKSAAPKLKTIIPKLTEGVKKAADRYKELQEERRAAGFNPQRGSIEMPLYGATKVTPKGFVRTIDSEPTSFNRDIVLGKSPPTNYFHVETLSASDVLKGIIKSTGISLSEDQQVSLSVRIAGAVRQAQVAFGKEKVGLPLSPSEQTLVATFKQEFHSAATRPRGVSPSEVESFGEHTFVARQMVLDFVKYGRKDKLEPLGVVLPEPMVKKIRADIDAQKKVSPATDPRSEAPSVSITAPTVEQVLSIRGRLVNQLASNEGLSIEINAGETRNARALGATRFAEATAEFSIRNEHGLTAAKCAEIGISAETSLVKLTEVLTKVEKDYSLSSSEQKLFDRFKSDYQALINRDESLKSLSVSDRSSAIASGLLEKALKQGDTSKLDSLGISIPEKVQPKPEVAPKAPEKVVSEVPIAESAPVSKPQLTPQNVLEIYSNKTFGDKKHTAEEYVVQGYSKKVFRSWMTTKPEEGAKVTIELTLKTKTLSEAFVKLEKGQALSTEEKSLFDTVMGSSKTTPAALLSEARSYASADGHVYAAQKAITQFLGAELSPNPRVMIPKLQQIGITLARWQ